MILVTSYLFKSTIFVMSAICYYYRLLIKTAFANGKDIWKVY